MTTPGGIGKPVGPRKWQMQYDARPWTVNAERTWHHMQRARKVREWREFFFYLAVQGRIPHLDGATFSATPLVANRRNLPDVGACYGAVKAAIDGIVQAGVLTDDSPAYVGAIHLYAPVVADRDALVVLIEEAPAPGSRQ